MGTIVIVVAHSGSLVAHSGSLVAQAFQLNWLRYICIVRLVYRKIAKYRFVLYMKEVNTLF